MKERVISLVIFVFSLIYLAGSISLPLGTIVRPGPGFVPAGIAFAILIVSAFNAYKAFRASAGRQTDGAWKRIEPIALAAGILVYPIILKPFAYIISTFLVLVFCLRILKYKTVVFSIVLSLVTSVFSFWLFSKVLGVVLPTGILEDMVMKF